MIPTQPDLPNPFQIPPQPWNNQSWQCQYCGQWIGNAQLHNCQGQTLPNTPLRAFEPLEIQSGGLMSDFMMYADFKKLMRNDTLAKFRERFLAGLLDLEQNTPEESGDSGLAIDAIMDIFDNVAKGINHNTDL